MSKQIKVVTSFNQSGYNLYGKEFLRTFFQYWPKNVRLELFLEGFDIRDYQDFDNDAYSNLKLYSIDEMDWLQDFIYRNPEDNKKGMIDGKYHMKFDAIKFSKKTAAIIEAALYDTSTDNSDIMFWLDADTITHDHISFQHLVDLVPDDVYTCYLGREQNPKPMYSECGFVGYNLKHDINQLFMEYWKSYYDNDALFALKEWHDSYVYDYIRKGMLSQNESKSWTSHLKDATGHPFIQIFGQYMDHLKGPRKERGRSGKHELVVKNTSPYWNS